MKKPASRPDRALRPLTTTELPAVTGGGAAPILKPMPKTASDDWLAPVV